MRTYWMVVVVASLLLGAGCAKRDVSSTQSPNGQAQDNDNTNVVTAPFAPTPRVQYPPQTTYQGGGG